MKRPKQRKNESDLSYMFRIAMWLSDPTRHVVAQVREWEKLPRNPDGTVTIPLGRPPRYLKSGEP